MGYYIVAVYDDKSVQRVLRLLRKNGVRTVAIAVLVSIDTKAEAGVLGGIRRLDSKNIAILRGYLPLPRV